MRRPHKAMHITRPIATLSAIVRDSFCLYLASLALSLSPAAQGPAVVFLPDVLRAKALWPSSLLSNPAAEVGRIHLIPDGVKRYTLAISVSTTPTFWFMMGGSVDCDTTS